MSNNAKKAEKLGMPYGTANNILKKNLLFSLAQKCGLDTCVCCDTKIESVDDFTIEHKTEWLNSETPKELFFDLDNVAFAHAYCNYAKGTERTTSVDRYGYRGIIPAKTKSERWEAFFYYKNKRHHVGTYATKEEAAQAHDKAVLEIIGDKALTNKKLGLL